MDAAGGTFSSLEIDQHIDTMSWSAETLVVLFIDLF
jgi:hypothetical protein